ncbi:uncharacterized protein LOC120346191 [Styela clava]
MNLFWFHVLLGFICNCLPNPVAFGAPEMKILSVTNVTSTSFVIYFNETSEFEKYHITLKERHSSVLLNHVITSSGKKISGLLSDTIYIVNIRGENGSGNIGPKSNSATVHTNPGPPEMRTSNKFPDSTFVFFHSKNYARVSEWTIQYKEYGTNNITTVTTASGQYYAHWLSGLLGDTNYELRARASKIYNTFLEEHEVEFSPWQNFTTASHLIFGRAVLTNQTTTALENINEAYSRLGITHNGIRIIEILNETSENPLVFYEMKVKDKTLPSNKDYILNGSKFSNSFVNNGDKSLGVPYISIIEFGYELSYNPDPSDCSDQTIERSMLVTPENMSTVEIPLVLIGSEGGSVVSFSIMGNKLNSNDGTTRTVPTNTVLGLATKFLVKDCLKNQNSTLLYTKYLEAIDVDTKEIKNPFFYTTVFNGDSININAATYYWINNGSSIILNIPSVDKAILYEISDEAGTVSTIIDEDGIDGSNFLKVEVPNTKNETERSLTLTVTARKHDGTESTSEAAMTLTQYNDMCSVCDVNATCTSNIYAVITCKCNHGFTGNGTTCVRYDTTSSTTGFTTERNEITTGATATTTGENYLYTSSGISETSSNVNVTTEMPQITSSSVTSLSPDITPTMFDISTATASNVASVATTSDTTEDTTPGTNDLPTSSGLTRNLSTMDVTEESSKTLSSTSPFPNITPTGSSDISTSAVSEETASFSASEASTNFWKWWIILLIVIGAIILFVVVGISVSCYLRRKWKAELRIGGAVAERRKKKMERYRCRCCPWVATLLIAEESSYWSIGPTNTSETAEMKNEHQDVSCCPWADKLWINKDKATEVESGPSSKRSENSDNERCSCCPWVSTLWINQSTRESKLGINDNQPSSFRESDDVDSSRSEDRMEHSHTCCPWAANLWINRSQTATYEENEQTNKRRYICCPWTVNLIINQRSNNGEQVNANSNTRKAIVENPNLDNSRKCKEDIDNIDSTAL